MIVGGYIESIKNVMCTVNIRGHEANFYEARCHEAEAEWFGLGLMATLYNNSGVVANIYLAERMASASL